METSAEDVADSLSTFMLALFITALAFNILLSTSNDGMGLMLIMMRSLQMVFILPILKILFPGNVMLIFNIAIPICMFDVLSDNSWDFSA